MSHYREGKDEQQDSSSSIAWFVTGALIGATAAVLYAPKSGKDTRQFIADRAQEGKDAVEYVTLARTVLRNAQSHVT